MAEEEPMKEKQLVASMAEHSAAVPSAMSAWERVGRNTAMGGTSPYWWFPVHYFGAMQQ